MTSNSTPLPDLQSATKTEQNLVSDSTKAKPVEAGGPKGLEPTRYGDWERNGKCVDF